MDPLTRNNVKFSPRLLEQYAADKQQRVTCPNCTEIFYRPRLALKQGTRCPKCHIALIWGNEKIKIDARKEYSFNKKPRITHRKVFKRRIRK